MPGQDCESYPGRWWLAKFLRRAWKLETHAAAGFGLCRGFWIELFFCWDCFPTVAGLVTVLLQFKCLAKAFEAALRSDFMFDVAFRSQGSSPSTRMYGCSFVLSVVGQFSGRFMLTLSVTSLLFHGVLLLLAISSRTMMHFFYLL